MQQPLSLSGFAQPRQIAAPLLVLQAENGRDNKANAGAGNADLRMHRASKYAAG